VGLGLLLVLTGCKTDLYSRLDQAEANRMMALLLSQRIEVDKQQAKEGITLRVDKSRFVEAVELLRQNGLPSKHRTGIEELFPSGQLVSSPEQEAAKLRYAKSQEMEKMLTHIEGVVSAEVSIAQNDNVDNPASSEPVSAAVLIKYSPAVNLAAREAEIRALVSDGIPGLVPERVSLVLQRIMLRLTDPPPSPAPSPYWQAVWALPLLAGLATGVWLWRRRRP
jgi:type III secretion protein J